MIGLNIRELNSHEKKKLGLNIGLKVVWPLSCFIRVETNICEGFIITAVNGQQVTSINKLEEMLNGEGVVIAGIYPDGTRDHYYTKSLSRSTQSQ